MSLTTPQAVSECMAVVAAAAAPWPGLLVRWPGLLAPNPPPASAAWWLPAMQHIGGGQASLSCEAGVRRWRRTGLLTVQCFVPLGNGSLQEATRMACAVRDAIQGTATPGGVWFRNATTKEIGPDASWYQVNALATFTYDEQR
jgi:hypothetical protein